MQENKRHSGVPVAGARIRGYVVRRTQEAPVDGNDFLCHYGILGQQWHVRRFQNEDRTLTEEGKKRYAKNKEPEKRRWKKEEAEDLTDEELNRRNSRLQRERTYKDLTTTKKEREQAAKKDWWDQQKKDAVKKIFIAGATVLAAAAVKKNYQKAISFIGKFGKSLFSKAKTSMRAKGVLNAAPNKYLTPHGSAGMIGSAGQRLNGVKRLFNYRPRVNNSLPKTRFWPTIRG